MSVRSDSSASGFTIVEVMIVLIIAAVILLIVFLAIPAFQRTSRNLQRKEAVAFITAEMGRYNSEHGTYPLTDDLDDRTGFISSLQGSIADRFRVRYAPRGEPHEYPFTAGNTTPEIESAMDEISIQPAHLCNRTSGLVAGDIDYPIETAPTGHLDYRQFVVWTQIEKGPVVCLDSAN